MACDELAALSGACGHAFDSVSASPAIYINTDCTAMSNTSDELKHKAAVKSFGLLRTGALLNVKSYCACHSG